MKTRKALVVLAAGLFALAATAGDEPTPAMDEAAMMEAWQKTMTPNEHHKHMADMIGEWDVKGQMWMAPGAPATPMHGTSKSVSILGGRFFQSTFDGEFMGMPFSGIGIDGYDIAAGQHISYWIDNMGTMHMTSRGQCENGGMKMTMTADFNDPITGQAKTMKMVSTALDRNTVNVVMYDVGVLPDGGDFKQMVFTYTRRAQ